MKSSFAWVTAFQTAMAWPETVFWGLSFLATMIAASTEIVTCSVSTVQCFSCAHMVPFDCASNGAAHACSSACCHVSVEIAEAPQLCV